MSNVLPAVLLNAWRQYKFNGSPLWRMADGKDHVKIEVTFRKTTNQRFDKRRAESRSSLLRPRRRPDRRLLADSRLWRRRHHQPSRHCKQQHPPPSNISASHRQQRSHHHRSSCDQQNRPFLQICRLRKSKEQSPKITKQPKEHFHVDKEEEYLCMRSMISRTSTPPPTRSS